MSEDDPFGYQKGDNRTKIRPVPGGRIRGQRSPVSSMERERPIDSVSGKLPNVHSNKNPLLASAFSLLALATQLRSTVAHTDVEGLRAHITREIKTFETRALQQGVLPENGERARYALCALFDDVILNTPWGNQSDWSQQSLLISFHQEAWGGEKFFRILDNLVKRAAPNLDLLEFFYCCLSLGFEGKYRVHEHGSTKLEDLRENLYLLIQRQKGEHEQNLSAHWQGIKDRRHALIRYVPLWVVGAVGAAMLMVVYAGFYFAANSAAKPLNKQLSMIALDKPSFDTRPIHTDSFDQGAPSLTEDKAVFDYPAPSRKQDLRRFLAADIERGLLEVIEGDKQTSIRIRNLFESGNDNIRRQHFSLLDRVARVLRDTPGEIIVTGHSDNLPIRTRRFPSNMHLSEARAGAVADLIKTLGRFERDITSGGRADEEPLVPNSNRENRALNRRVEIIVRQ